MKKNKGRKPVGNSGLYGRVTKKQMGGAAKPVGMSGPGFLAGEIPPDGSGKKDLRSIFDFEPSEEDLKRNRAKENYYKDRARNEGPIMRTNDFQDEDMNGVDDRDESSRGKKRRSGRGGNVPEYVKTGPGRGPRSPSRDQLQRIQEMLAGKADRGGRNPGTRMPRLPGADRGTPPSRGRGIGKIVDRLKDQARRRTESPYEPKMPGGGRLRPPVMGPDPDIGKMMPRRFEGLGATLVDALGIKSKGMGDKSRREPPRPRTTGGRRGRGRRK